MGEHDQQDGQVFEPCFQVLYRNAQVILDRFPGQVHVNGYFLCRKVVEVVFYKNAALLLWQNGYPCFQEIDELVHIHLVVCLERRLQHCFK